MLEYGGCTWCLSFRFSSDVMDVAYAFFLFFSFSSGFFIVSWVFPTDMVCKRWSLVEVEYKTRETGTVVPSTDG